jgi:hypothetical protein
MSSETSSSTKTRTTIRLVTPLLNPLASSRTISNTNEDTTGKQKGTENVIDDIDDLELSNDVHQTRILHSPSTIMKRSESFLKMFMHNVSIHSRNGATANDEKGLKRVKSLFEMDGDDKTMIGTRTVAQLKHILSTDNRFGYMTMNQFIEFGMRYGFNHPSFTTIFTTTYKTFTVPKKVIPSLREVLDSIVIKNEKDKNNVEWIGKQNRIIQRTTLFLRYWISNCKLDFIFDKHIREDLFSFIGSLGMYICPTNDTMAIDDSSSYETTQNKVFELAEFSSKILTDLKQNTDKQFTKEDLKKKMKNWPKSYLLSRAPKDPRQINILDVNPIEIARQLTLTEFAIFEKVTSEELLGLGWNKDSKEWTAPNITEIISRSNTTTDWVATMILHIENVKDRSRMLKHFVLIAEACYKLYNFNTLFEIVMALISNPIYRLKQSWEGIGVNENQKFKKLEQICDFAGNRKNYREELRKVPSTQSCLPYLGVSLTDLVFFDEGNKSSKKTTEKEANNQSNNNTMEASNAVQENTTDASSTIKSYINFTKCSLMAGVVSSLMDFKSRPYQLRPVLYLQQFLYYSMHYNIIRDETELERISRLREQRKQ